MTPRPACAPWLVVVEHGNGPRSTLDRLLTQVQRATACHVERVRTDQAPGQVLPDPNEALEFSGYQEGLARLLATCPDDAARDEPVTIVFANDTLIAGHVRGLALLVLEALLRLSPQSGRERLLVGLNMPIHPAMCAVTGPYGYISTWAFALHARPSQLRSVRFYAETEVMSRFQRLIQPTLPETYRLWLASWLEPKHLLRGWYKAMPGVPLDQTTRLRKELTIYLEHGLVARLAALGFNALDVAELLSGPGATELAVLRRLDRAHVNWLKLRLRAPALLGNRWRS